MRYVLYWCERLRDGTEEGARVYGSVEAALKGAARVKNGWNPHTVEVRLFELGEEVPIAEEAVEEPQPAKKTIGFRLAQPRPEVR